MHCWQRPQQSCEWSNGAAVGDGACSPGGNIIHSQVLAQGSSMCAAGQWHGACQNRAGLVPRLDLGSGQLCVRSRAMAWGLSESGWLVPRLDQQRRCCVQLCKALSCPHPAHLQRCAAWCPPVPQQRTGMGGLGLHTEQVSPAPLWHCRAQDPPGSPCAAGRLPCVQGAGRRGQTYLWQGACAGAVWLGRE